jgi:inward rectifier potassium channel
MSKKTKSLDNLGYDNIAKKANRYYDANGQPTIIRKGVRFQDRYSLFHDLLTMKLWQFIILIFSTYLVINLVFAGIYFMLGPESLGLQVKEHYCWETFMDCFFFSAQTLTTVGYGRISPISISANIAASLESLIGLLLFSVITGLSYGRFAKPNFKLLFSKNAVLVPHREQTAFMIRLVSPTKYLLSNVKASITLGMNELVDGIEKQEFYRLDLEVNDIVNLILSWTLVHYIDENSPLYGLDIAALKSKNAEFFITIQAFDEHSSSIIQKRKSYIADDLLEGRKFKKMFAHDDEMGRIILHIDELDELNE